LEASRNGVLEVARAASPQSFDGSTPTRFGFAAGNSQSATLTQYYDNWSITYALPVAGATPTNVPTLSQWVFVLLATLVAFAGVPARRRRRQSAPRPGRRPAKKDRPQVRDRLRDPRDGNLAVAVLRNRDVGIGVEALLFVTRGAVLIASHSHQDHHEREPQRPAN
jgi:hypothetical protein